jgi:hypothetical protein
MMLPTLSPLPLWWSSNRMLAEIRRWQKFGAATAQIRKWQQQKC